MPISRNSIGRGFTLLELLVVLVIMVVMGSVVMMSMMPVLDEARLHTGSRSVVSTLTYARSYAVTRRTDTRVVFDSERNGLYVEARRADDDGHEEMTPLTTPAGKFRVMPEDVTLGDVQQTNSTGQERAPEEDAETAITFSPLGQSEPATVTVLGARKKLQMIVLDPITGRCTITNGTYE